MSVKNIYTHDQLPFIGAFFALLFWFVDAVVDFLVFDEAESLSEAIFEPEPVELWMRTLVVVLLMMLSFIARNLLRKNQGLLSELKQHKENLEHLVEEQSAEIHEKNSRLEEEIKDRARAEEKLGYLSTLDPETLLFNKRTFTKLLMLQFARESEDGAVIGLANIALDNFEDILKTEGQDAISEFFRESSRQIKEFISDRGVVSRWGDDQLMVMDYTSTPDEFASQMEKMKSAIMNSDHSLPNLSLSMGYGLQEPLDTEYSLIKRATAACSSAV